ncbi:MAG: DUF3327 domain-containing protein [Hamadaea sp.]|nr:DUF3327 domain-containing protein [Hamadaea sp.]
MQMTPDGVSHCLVEFTWSEDDAAHPARSVLLRLLTPTDFANDDGDLSPYLMTRDDGVWRVTLRLPSDLRTSYQFCPVRDRELPATVGADDWEAVCALGVPDPANPAGIGPSTWPNHGSAAVLELPAARPQPWHARRPGVARGEVTQHTLGSSEFWVYTPHGYAGSSADAALAILFDGKVWAGIDVAATLDNLHAEGLVPPTVVVGVASIRGLPRNASLVDSGVLMSFLLDDLMPVVTEGWRVTADPARTVLAGQSLGGLAATHAALRAPDRFGLVLTQSGSFWRGANGDGEIDSPALMDEIAREDPRPIRIFQEAGSLERNLLVKNRILYGVLLARGYPVTYREYQGGHDYACWRGGLADGLVALLGR